MDKFLRLKIKTKLTFGIGLLFTMIVLLGGLAGCAEYYGYVFRHAEYLGG